MICSTAQLTTTITPRDATSRSSCTPRCFFAAEPTKQATVSGGKKDKELAKKKKNQGRTWSGSFSFATQCKYLEPAHFASSFFWSDLHVAVHDDYTTSTFKMSDRERRKREPTHTHTHTHTNTCVCKLWRMQTHVISLRPNCSCCF